MKEIKNEYKVDGDIVIIYLNNRKGEIFETVIDLEDFDKVSAIEGTWFSFYSKKTESYYAKYSEYISKLNNNKGRPSYTNVYMHRLIMDVLHERKIYIDHKNHDTLCNLRHNLRSTSNENNSKNRNGKNKNNTSGYRNVFWTKKDERWLVMLQIEGKQTCFGRFKFEDLDKAGVRAEEMRQKYYKEFAGTS